MLSAFPVRSRWLQPDGLRLEGGGWWAPSQGGAARMIGLNSFNLASQPDWEFGPVFDGTIQDLARHMAGLSPA